jgi:hypothetical protein
MCPPTTTDNVSSVADDMERLNDVYSKAIFFHGGNGVKPKDFPNSPSVLLSSVARGVAPNVTPENGLDVGREPLIF